MKLHFSLLSFLIACGGESVIEKQQNTAPVIMIGSHSPDAEILEGYTETFRASVSDDNNTYEELTVAWYVGENLVCDWETVSPAGESFCDITFDAEDANVIAETIKGLEIKIPSKVGSGDKLFGSVNNINLAEAIAKSGTEIDKKFIKVVGGSVKRLGKYNASVRLHREVVADITFEVVSES